MLGKGAFGTVYLGLNQDTGELMAVKKIDKSEMSAKELADMEGEVKMMEGFCHDNIVRYVALSRGRLVVRAWASMPSRRACCVMRSYLSTTRSEQTLLIFLEYVPGGSIRQLIERFGPFDESVRV